ncbi:MAG TPA: glycosyltransferase family 4 protein [Isosphaeraceae bacterium]|jgi:glycosyltransferase involved in cell wall biosynthesis|nr:glycosyltransferase family 4 protein [Isosphaeraceae bacterium]
MRVLLLAEHCNPAWPSLPVVGYRACKAIGDHVEAVVATHVRNVPEIDRAGLGRCEVVALDNEYIARPMYALSKALRGGTSVAWTTNIAMAYPSYLAFEREVWRRFGADLRAGRFDLVHRVTPMSPTLPSPMAKWSPVPFVLGPLNGGLRWPPGFGGELAREREWMTYVRGAHRLLPYHRATLRRSAAILASFAHTIADLPPAVRDRVIDFPEVGIEPSLFSAPPERRHEGPLTLLYAGRLVPYKCPDVLLLALAANPELRRHRTVIVGEGPERARLDRIVAEHGLGDCVEFTGNLPQARVGDLMRAADVFVFPSIRELGAGVVVEAMACGLACVVVDYGAPGRLVGPGRGVRVPLGTKDELVAAFAAELGALVGDPGRVAALGAAARDHALAHYDWDVKARKTVEVYRWVLGQRAEKPTFD